MKEKRPERSIITEQKVDRAKLERAYELRKQMTAAEIVLWECLRNRRLMGFHFRRQQIIQGWIVDFYCHSASLVIEVDGDVHQDQAEYDRERESNLLDLGLTVLRFTNQEVINDLEIVLERIKAHLPHPPAPLSL